MYSDAKLEVGKKSHQLVNEVWFDKKNQICFCGVSYFDYNLSYNSSAKNGL